MNNRNLLAVKSVTSYRIISVIKHSHKHKGRNQCTTAASARSTQGN